MTPFGWIMVVFLTMATIQSEKAGRGVALFLLIGTLVWGTGNI
jgi:hypothetical protein